jgi:cysteine desulfurase family protein
MIYLDNSATSWPKPEIVYRATDEFFRNKAGNPGRGSHSMALAAGDIIQETRELLAKFINTPEPYRVIFTLNCTDSLNMGLKGLLKPGDHVITDSIGHNSLVRPLHKLGKKEIKVTRIPPAPDTGCITPADIASAITDATKLVAITHGSNVNGVIQPVAEYGKVVREHNLIFMVDAAQTAGIIPLDVRACNIDILAFSGHKGLYGPPGTGVLYIGDRVDLETVREGGTGSYSEMEEQPQVLPDAFESGTLNSAGIAGLGAGIKFILSEGLEKIREHEVRLTRRLVAGLSEIKGIVGYKAKENQPQAPVISFNLFGYLAHEVGEVLDKTYDIKVRPGLHCSPQTHRVLLTFPTGTVRLSPGYFNTEAEIDFTLEAIAKIPPNTSWQGTINRRAEWC